MREMITHLKSCYLRSLEVVLSRDVFVTASRSEVFARPKPK